MLEYARILLILFCVRAARLPIVIVSTAMTASIRLQSRLNTSIPNIIALNAAAKPAFLVAADSNALMVVGAPS